MELVKKVQRYINTNRLPDSSSTVIVGVSGGADSTALLKVLLVLGYRCIAVHCNFHLRGAESNRDQQFVTELCRNLGVELIICCYDTAFYAKQKNISVEMAARELRYADFERIMQERGADAVCVAHHREDSNETLLLNLIRGTGIKGLTGIKPRNGHIIRPLLCVSRHEIEEWLDKLGQPYITDSTNLETDYTRNKIRLELMPLIHNINPSADTSIGETARHLQQAYAFYSQAIRLAKNQVVTGSEQEFSIDINMLRQVPSIEGLLFEILSPLGFNDTQISSVSESIDSQPGIRFCSATHQLLKDRDCFVVSPIGEPINGSVLINIDSDSSVTLPDGRTISITRVPAGTPISADPCTATLDAALITGSLITVRRWHDGDWFIPFGMKGRKLVSDFLTDIKTGQAERRNQLVAIHKDNIIWVVGLRSDNRYRVTSRTRNQIILKLE